MFLIESPVLGPGPLKNSSSGAQPPESDLGSKPSSPNHVTGQVADVETPPCLQNIRTELGARDCCYQRALVKLRHVASQTIPLGQSDQYSCLENPMDREEPGRLQSMGLLRVGHN